LEKEFPLNTHARPDDSGAGDPGHPGGPGLGDEVSRMLSQALDDAVPASLLSPIKIPTAVEEITDRLITTIAIGEILPGSRLPAEREMAALLKVSRSTIREAIGRLAAIGLIEIRRGRLGGAYVTTSWTEASARSVQRTLLPRWEELEQLFDLCALVEATVARAAAERRSDTDLIAIRAALDSFANASSQAEEQSTDQVFHHAIRQATRNPQLGALNRELITRISLGFPFEPWRDPDLGGEGSKRALNEHIGLAAAIADRDAERAGRIACEHSNISAEIIRETLERAARTL
jgi:GntR family transcriptional regulator, transcriptional repressor for pyruvate dehydrogenase complex